MFRAEVTLVDMDRRAGYRGRINANTKDPLLQNMGDDENPKAAKKASKQKLAELNKLMDRVKDLVEKGKWDEAEKERAKARKLKYEFIELLPDVLDTPFVDWYKGLNTMDRYLDLLIERLIDHNEKGAKDVIESFEEEKKKLKGYLGIK